MTNETYTLIRFINENTVNAKYDILDEAAQANLSNAVLDNMLKLTIGKYSKIDFSEISRSKGNFKQCSFYKNLTECIATLDKINKVTGKLELIDTVKTTLTNIETFRPQFENGFKHNDALTVMMYNSICYAIMEITTYLLATSLSFTKKLDGQEYSVNIKELDKKTVPLISAVQSFNNACSNGNILKFFNLSKEELNESVSMLNESNVLEWILGTGSNMLKKSKVHEKILDFISDHDRGIKKTATIGFVGILVIVLLSLFIPTIREIIYWIYRCRHTISESARVQAEFLKCNIAVLESSGADEKIIAKQKAAVERFEYLANKIGIDSDKANRDTKIDIDADKIDASAIVF